MALPTGSALDGFIEAFQHGYNPKGVLEGRDHVASQYYQPSADFFGASLAALDTRAATYDFYTNGVKVPITPNGSQVENLPTISAHS